MSIFDINLPPNEPTWRMPMKPIDSGNTEHERAIELCTQSLIATVRECYNSLPRDVKQYAVSQRMNREVERLVWMRSQPDMGLRKNP